MKQLTKEQLIDLVFDKCAEIILSNAEEIKENISNEIKGSENNGNEILVKFVTSYDNEMRRVCCQTIAETLYDVLYSEWIMIILLGGNIEMPNIADEILKTIKYAVDK